MRSRLASRISGSGAGTTCRSGPHTRAMYQILFGPDRLKDFLPWLMLNRQGLAVLVHPETGNDYKDHAEHAVWLGEMLPLKLEVLAGGA